MLSDFRISPSDDDELCSRKVANGGNGAFGTSVKVDAEYCRNVNVDDSVIERWLVGFFNENLIEIFVSLEIIFRANAHANSCFYKQIEGPI